MLSKRKKYFIGVIVIIVLIFGLLATSGIAEASEAIYACKVVAAGPYRTDKLVYFVLNDVAANPAFTNKFFQAAAGRENQMLAVALTAISSGMKISIITNLKSGEKYPTIARMYLLSE